MAFLPGNLGISSRDFQSGPPARSEAVIRPLTRSPNSPEGVVTAGCVALSPQLRYDEGLHEVPDELGVGTHVFGAYPHIAAQWLLSSPDRCGDDDP